MASEEILVVENLESVQAEDSDDAPSCTEEVPLDEALVANSDDDEMTGWSTFTSTVSFQNILCAYMREN